MKTDQDADNAVNAFTIECSEGKTVHVDEKDAKKVLKRSEYFRNVFAHGTKESESRVIRKPDWTSQIAAFVIKAHTSGSAKIPWEHAYDASQAFGSAADIQLSCPTT
jgi:hypothetical protein